MQNDTQIAFGMHSRNFVNRLLNLCVGKSVGGKSREVQHPFSIFIADTVAVNNFNWHSSCDSYDKNILNDLAR